MKLYKLDMILCFPILQRQKNAFMTTINASKKKMNTTTAKTICVLLQKKRHIF